MSYTPNNGYVVEHNIDPKHFDPGSFRSKLRQLELSSSARLSDLTNDVAYFSTGLFFSYGGLDKDPVQEYVNEFRSDVAVISSNKPIFSGMGHPWDCTLLAAPLECWVDMRSFLAATCILNRSRNFLMHAFYREVSILDFLDANRRVIVSADDVVKVRVTVFGLRGSHGIVYVDDSSNLILSPPKVVIIPPGPETKKKFENFIASLQTGSDFDPKSLPASMDQLFGKKEDIL